MADAINAIVDFFNLVIDQVITFITYLVMFFKFIAKGVVFLYDCLTFIPVELQAFAIITIVLTVILLILGRSNNSG